MTQHFESVHNFHERAVFQAVVDATLNYPHLADKNDLLADVACVALNRLAPRYLRHEVDFAFYLSEKERATNERDISESVQFAFEFVQARVAMRARR